MLRLVFLALLLANALYYAWAHGMLQELGFAPALQTEPDRLAQQVQAKTLRVLPAAEAARVEAAVRNGNGGANNGNRNGAGAAECLQAGPFDDTQAGALRQVLEAGWPPGAWALAPTVEPARWMIYMGRYADAEALNRKKAELRQRKVLFQNLPNPSMEPGLSLGSFAAQDAAERELAALAERGVRTARVVQERPEVRGQLLRLPTVDDELRGRLAELRPQLAGKALAPCRS